MVIKACSSNYRLSSWSISKILNIRLWQITDRFIRQNRLSSISIVLLQCTFIAVIEIFDKMNNTSRASDNNSHITIVWIRKWIKFHKNLHHSNFIPLFFSRPLYALAKPKQSPLGDYRQRSWIWMFICRSVFKYESSRKQFQVLYWILFKSPVKRQINHYLKLTYSLIQ